MACAAAAVRRRGLASDRAARIAAVLPALLHVAAGSDQVTGQDHPGPGEVGAEQPPRDGNGFMVFSFCSMVAIWAALFYLLAFTERRWARSLAKSSKPHENCKYYVARNVIGTVFATLVAVITVPCALLLFNAREEIRFAHSHHVATCRVPEDMYWIPNRAQWELVAQGVAFAGLAFTSFTFLDIFICLAHGMSSPDFIVHHVAFVVAGLIIRGNCMLPLNAAILMAMEVSTPFLNFMLLYRHRGDKYASIVTYNGIAFVLLFVLSRLVLNTYGAVLLWLNRDKGLFPLVPAWQAWFLLIAVAAGAGVQFFWFPQIWRIFSKGMSQLAKGGPVSASEEDSGVAQHLQAVETSDRTP